MNINKNDTAIVVIDPQNDVLSETGVSWDLVGESVKANKTVENIERIFKAAKQNDFEVFISPHYYYPTDYNWKFAGTLEQMMLGVKEFTRTGPLTLDGFVGSGADWLDRYKPFIEDGKTIVVSPIRSMDRKATILCCNCGSVTSTKSFCSECWQIFVWKPTCAT
jgi:hypothetical protein